MAVDSDALCTLQNVKDYLKIESTNHENDQHLSDLINRVTDLFESYCHRKFKAAEYTEYHCGDGGDKVFPRNKPINSVSALYDDLDRAYTSAELFSPDDYAIVDSRYVQLDGLTFYKALNNIKIVYNGGYATIPGDLAQACIEQVSIKYNEGRLHHTLGVTSKSLGVEGASMSFSEADILPQIKVVLRRYMRIF